MEITERTRVNTAQRQVKGHEATVLLVYSIFAIVLLIAIFRKRVWQFVCRALRVNVKPTTRFAVEPGY